MVRGKVLSEQIRNSSCQAKSTHFLFYQVLLSLMMLEKSFQNEKKLQLILTFTYHSLPHCQMLSVDEFDWQSGKGREVHCFLVAQLPRVVFDGVHLTNLIESSTRPTRTMAAPICILNGPNIKLLEVILDSLQTSSQFFCRG